MARLPLHPRLAGWMSRARRTRLHQFGADLAALLSERDISAGALEKYDTSARTGYLPPGSTSFVPRRKGTVIPDGHGINGLYGLLTGLQGNSCA